MRSVRTHPFARGLGVLIAGIFLWSFLGPATSPAFAQTTDAAGELAKARDYYVVGSFEIALERVTALLESGGLASSDRRDAHVLRAQCETALGRTRNAIDAYCEAVRIDASWAPDPDFFTDQDLQAFERAKKQCGGPGTSGDSATTGDRDRADYLPPPASSQPWYKKRSTHLAAGVAGAVVLGIVLFGGGGDDGGGSSSLPDPPPPPG